MNRPLMTVEFDKTDCRFILESLRNTEAQWLHINQTTTDEDEQADYGNDLIMLRMIRKGFETAALEAFGPSVSIFSRAPAGLTPRSGDSLDTQ